MLLLYLLILILQNQIQSLDFQKNAEIEFIIFCYENKSPRKYCHHGRGYKNCGISLLFCASNIYIENEEFSQQWCNLFESEYKINNTGGMCKNGKYDTRGRLKDKMKFKVFLTEKIKIYLKISILTDLENRPVRTSLLSYILSENINKSIITMTNEDNVSEELIKVQLQRKITCLDNFHGKLCEKYCINPKEISSCKINEAGICTSGWFNNSCNHSEFKEKIKQCEPLSEDGSCENQLKNCFDNLKCEKLNSSKASKQLSKIHSDKTDPYLKFLVNVITVIGCGMLVIIFILLATVLLMWKIKKKEVIQIYRNSRSHIYRHSYIRQNIPLPTVESGNSDYSNIDSTTESYMRPSNS